MTSKTWEVLANQNDPASSIIIFSGDDDLLEVFHRGRATVSRTQAEAIEIAKRIVAGDSDRAELEQLRKYAHDITCALTALAGGGSELFGKQIGQIYTADISFCVERIRDRESTAHKRLIEAVKKNRDHTDRVRENGGVS